MIIHYVDDMMFKIIAGAVLDGSEWKVLQKIMRHIIFVAQIDTWHS